MKGFMWVMAILFGILAIVCYNNSIVRTGYGEVANVQMAVFAAASAVACVMNIIGALIVSAINSITNESHVSTENVSDAVVKAMEENASRREEEKVQEANKKEEEKRQEEERLMRKKQLETQKAQGGLSDVESFLLEIEDEASAIRISEIWDKYHLSLLFVEADQQINKRKSIERMYGKPDRREMESFKSELRKMLEE